jgi:hypothetical protein
MRTAGFAARQLRREIERRYGLSASPALTSPEEIKASEAMIVQLEIDVWVTRAAQTAAIERRAA